MVADSPFAKVASVVPDPSRSPIVKLPVGTPSKKPPPPIYEVSMVGLEPTLQRNRILNPVTLLLSYCIYYI